MTLDLDQLQALHQTWLDAPGEGVQRRDSADLLCLAVPELIARVKAAEGDDLAAKAWEAQWEEANANVLRLESRLSALVAAGRKVVYTLKGAPAPYGAASPEDFNALVDAFAALLKENET